MDDATYQQKKLIKQKWLDSGIGRDRIGNLTPLSLALGAISNYGCDCSEDEPGTCIQCLCENALMDLHAKVVVLEAEKEKMISAKWRTYDVPDNFDDMLIAEVELSSGEKEFYLCVIGDDGMMMDPESRDDLGWDVECISRWMPFDEFLTWANGGES